MNREELTKYSPAFIQDFDKYLQDSYQSLMQQPFDFFQLPAELQLGVYIKFLQENTIDLEIYNTSIEGIQESIIEGIKTYQNIAGHYS